MSNNYDLGVDLDFDDIKGVADEGMYLLRCVEAEIRQTKGKETIPDARNLFLTWQILKPEEWIGAPDVLDVLSLSKKMRRVLKEKLEGMTGKVWDQSGMRIVPREFIGMFAWASLVVDKYNDRDINKIRQYFPDSDQVHDPEEEESWEETSEPVFPWMQAQPEETPGEEKSEPMSIDWGSEEEPF
jgi:hypothetical protein